MSNAAHYDLEDALSAHIKTLPDAELRERLVNWVRRAASVSAVNDLAEFLKLNK